ncbi:MAG: TRAP transporter large permease subunit [Campylobacteraceae bacterium]|nr:TRAP transporter large permease subunit [Campylobacteraceae bacterium]
MSAFIILFILILLLVLRVPVAFSLGGLGVALLAYFPLPLNAIPQRLYGTMDSFELLAIPMFLLMSNVLLKGKVGKDLFEAVQSWIGHYPGGLGVATILSCGIFSAVSGSSVATAATIGTVAIPEMTKRGYPKHFVYGLLAAGGTLGIMIPPSIPLIIYGIISESSIPKLFLAGIGPGLFLIVVFITYSVLYSKISKNYHPIPKASWKQRYIASLRALPTIIIATSVIGSIYAGIATPSESAGVGFIMSLIVTFVMGRMNFFKLKEAVYDSAKTTIMIFMIIAGAKVFSYAITLYMIPQNISELLIQNITSPTLFIFAIGLVLLIIGFFLESLSMLLIMVPVLFPAIMEKGIDAIWFGLFFVILIETALITPPVGMNLFIIQAISNAKITEIVRGVWPFVLIMLGTAVLLWFWQDLALYIPYHF